MLQRMPFLRCAGKSGADAAHSDAQKDKAEAEKKARKILQSYGEWVRKEELDPEGLKAILDEQRKMEYTKPAKGADIWYGIPEDSLDKHFTRNIGNHRFTLCPVSYAKSEVLRSHLYKHYPGPKAPLTVEKIENSRLLVNGLPKKDKMMFLGCVMHVQYEYLSQAFQDPKWQVNYASLERMLYPKYLPSFKEAKATFRLPVRWRYRPEYFPMLENICRFPLDRVDQSTGATFKLTFEEWNSLFFNYYIPITPLRFFFHLTGTSILYTREFIAEFAEYLRERCVRMGNTTQPILDILTSNGKLAYHLNRTGRIPVPVVPCHENPDRNSYNLKIPRDAQSAFHLPPPRKIDIAAALGEYRPNIVICQDMPLNKDLSRQFRAEGSVREYILLGVPHSYLSGHPWYTWGQKGNKPKDDNSTVAHHKAAGFAVRGLDHLSRWLIDTYDSHVATGFAQVISFVKEPFAHSLRERVGYKLRRLQLF